MSPTDARHGTIAGFVHHSRAGVPTCEPCLTAKRRYEKLRQIHGARKVSALGTQRRIQALRALGYSLGAINLAGGWCDKTALDYALKHDTITRTTAQRVAEVYERLCMTPATSPKAHRMRLLAAERGWLPPLAWDDIDRDPHPATGEPVRDYVDGAVVDRFFNSVNATELADLAKQATTATRHAVTDAWLAADRAWNDLERITGWRHGRYGSTRREAA